MPVDVFCLDFVARKAIRFERKQYVWCTGQFFIIATFDHYGDISRVKSSGVSVYGSHTAGGVTSEKYIVKSLLVMFFEIFRHRSVEIFRV
jgi:predicted NAD-dependent protein-ADP-ribosyltransferase YbiA (DUF1768 family)